MVSLRIKALAREHDSLMDEGQELFEKLEPIQRRVLEIRAIIESENLDDDFDGVELLFAGRMTSLYREPQP